MGTTISVANIAVVGNVSMTSQNSYHGWSVYLFIHTFTIYDILTFFKKNVSKFNVSSINRTIIQVQYIYFPFTCLNRATGRSVILLMLKLCLKINYGYLLSTSINMPSVQRVNLHKLRWTSGPGLYWSRRHTVRRKFIWRHHIFRMSLLN